MARLSLRNVTKKCPNNDLVVKNFSLDIGEHEFVVLAGPAGCGKSLVIRMIAGLEESDFGDIYIDGELVNRKETKDRGVAMIFQNYALYPHMNVYDNIAFALKLARMPQDEIDRRIHKTAEFISIKGILDQMPDRLSEEEILQTVIARAIVKDPKVLLMDDPLSRIAEDKRRFIEEKIVELSQKMEIPFVYATQEQRNAMDMGTRIVVMNEGEIRQEGAPKELYTRPANTFTAFFLGEPHINMVQASVEEKKGDIVLRFGSSELLLSADQAGVLKEMGFVGGNVFLGVRPEDMSVASDDAEVFVKNAIVENCKEENGRSWLCTSSEENSWVLPDNGTGLQPENMVNLTVEPEKIHIFCAETGERIC
ncbi:ABC transporter ATP-binding protein [Lachnospiraceae bacterium 62-35]